MKIKLTCPHCYAYLEISGAVCQSPFPEDAIEIDRAMVKFCPVCGRELEKEKEC